jgi:hypothetical protein
MGKREEKLLKIINKINPDILAITGDAIAKPKAVYEYVEMINGFRAKWGKFGVWGNVEHRVLEAEEMEKIKNSEINILENEAVKIKEGLWIVGVNDPFTGYDDLGEALKGVPKEAFKILLAHSPIIAKEASMEGIDLVLSGHTHGGQIYIPGLSHLVCWLYGSGGYVAGLYRVGETHLYVTTGVGTTLLPLRAFCPPEIAILRLERKEGL